MKKIILKTLLLLTLTGCQSNEQKITVVATEIPHAEILYATRPLLKDQGYTLNVEVINNYALGNPAVANGSADANYFQHIPYFDAYNKTASANKKLANVANVHIEPIGLYSGAKASVTDLADGDKIIISDNAPDYGRIVNFLVELELVTVVNDFLPTNTYSHPEDAILSKSVDFSFQIIDAHLLVAARSNSEGALFFINGNYALSGGLKRSDVLIQEPTVNNPYVNIVATKVGNEESPKIKALVSALTSETIKTYINDTYAGAVIAV